MASDMRVLLTSQCDRASLSHALHAIGPAGKNLVLQLSAALLAKVGANAPDEAVQMRHHRLPRADQTDFTSDQTRQARPRRLALINAGGAYAPHVGSTIMCTPAPEEILMATTYSTSAALGSASPFRVSWGSVFAGAAITLVTYLVPSTLSTR
jgi:hypothetical protein